METECHNINLIICEHKNYSNGSLGLGLEVFPTIIAIVIETVSCDFILNCLE